MASYPNRQYRLGALAIYALLFAPLTHWVIATRCARVLLIECRRARADRVREVIEEVATDPALPLVDAVPPGLSAAELDVMLLRCLRAGQDTQLARPGAGARRADPNCLPAADERRPAPPGAGAGDRQSRPAPVARADPEGGRSADRASAGVSPLIAATKRQPRRPPGCGHDRSHQRRQTRSRRF